jgi:prepilin-type processing-associated H-X9-DG protein
MGSIGGSLLWGHGSNNDHGPNACGPDTNVGNDEIMSCSETQQAYSLGLLVGTKMNCQDQTGNTQATARSLHPGGAHIGMCDGSVLFIDDSIDCAASVQDVNLTREDPTDFGVWERLMSAGDGYPLPANMWP